MWSKLRLFHTYLRARFLEFFYRKTKSKGLNPIIIKRRKRKITNYTRTRNKREKNTTSIRKPNPKLKKIQTLRKQKKKNNHPVLYQPIKPPTKISEILRKYIINRRFLQRKMPNMPQTSFQFRFLEIFRPSFKNFFSWSK